MSSKTSPSSVATRGGAPSDSNDRQSAEAADRWQAEIGGIRVLFGEGSLGDLGATVQGLGGKRVLLVSDRGLRQAGHLATAKAALDSHHLKVHVFDEVEADPTSEHVENGAAYAADLNIDFLVALGGGSALDCAKGINFLLTNGGQIHDYHGMGRATAPMLPSVGVPTTAGTGSEAQSFCVIADPQTHRKIACGDPKARFRSVVLDPSLVASTPPAIAAAAGMDALAHAVESFVSRRRNPISMLLARHAWSLLEDNFEALWEAPNEPGPRGRMLLGAHLAGAAIEQSMLGAAHACANPLTAHCGLTHGVAVALMLPEVIRYNSLELERLYADLRNTPAGEQEVTAGEAIAAQLVRFRAAVNLPERLRDVGVRRSAIPQLAEQAAREWTAGFNPRPVDAQKLARIYESAF